MTPKERRANFKSRGLCTNCGRVPPIAGRAKCVGCTEAFRISSAKYRTTNPNAKASKNRWKENPVTRQKYRDTRRIWRAKFREKIVSMLGGKCECCQEDRLPFLQIDHKNKDGHKHRKEVGTSLKFLRDVWKNPTRYELRILCASCHFAITNQGFCPHELA